MKPHSIRAVAIAAVLAVPVVIGQSSSAAELAPYSLPSQQFQYSTPSLAAKPPPRADAMDSFYRRFADESRALKADARLKLKTNLSSSREAALRAGKIQEAEHFSRLVKILEAGA